MKPPRFLLLLLIVASTAGTSLRAQLMDLSFDTTTWFRQDFVNTDFYLDSGSAHFDFRFDATRPLAADDFVRIRVTNDLDGSLVFDDRWALDRRSFTSEDNYYSFHFREEDLSDPNRPWSERLDLAMWITEGGENEDGVFVPPQVRLDYYLTELYVYGWSPLIDYETPGHGGFFKFGPETTNVTFQFVPVPEPSTYGLTALVLLGAAAGWRRWRAARPETSQAESVSSVTC